MIKLENYTFKKRQPQGKYRTLVQHFLDSNESLMAWECNDKSEFNRVIHGFNKVVHGRNLKNLVRVKQCREDLVVGLERVNKDDHQ